MNRMSSIWLKLGDLALKRRWWWISFTSASVIFYEFLEYLPHVRGITPLFLFEVIAYGIALPLSTGIALSALAASRSELAWSTYYQNLIPNLALQLHRTQTYDELASLFLQFVRVVIPVIGVAVYKHEQNGRNFQVVLNWSLENASMSDLNFSCASDVCPFLTVEDPGRDEMALQRCRDSNIVASSRGSSCFCLPFLFSNSLIAGARFYFSDSIRPSPEQTRLLKEIAPVIASTFQRIHLERMMERQGKQMTVEQQRIARDVHDTLGHSLAYLRLRLDQINMEIDQTEVNTLHKEMESLRDVAKEAYDQMRRVLNQLSPNDDSNLSSELVNYADKISQQAGFKFKIQSQGKARTLSPIVQRNIFYIFQEILTNIEKHAHARKVGIHLRWEETQFEVEVVDDGVGFDISNPIPNGHFGLHNIRERALESNATLSILSQPEHGTQFTLRVPYEGQS